MFFPKLITLRVSLLSLITTLVVGAVFTMGTYNYIKSSMTAKAIARNLLAEVNDKASIKIDAMLRPIVALGNRIQELPGLEDKPVLAAHEATAYLIDTLSSYPYIYSVYMGYADDDLYQIISLDKDSEAERRQIRAPEGTRFALRRIMVGSGATRVELWRFLDDGCRTLGSRLTNAVSFRPTSRPWYTLAIRRDGVVHTPPYPFASTRSLGLTVARRFDGETPGVFGIDLTLASVSRFLARQKIGENGLAFLFGKDGTLLAHPDPGLSVRSQSLRKGASLVPTKLTDLHDPIIDAIYGSFLEGDSRTGMVDFTLDGKEYIGCISPVTGNNLPGCYMAVVAPVRDFTRDLERTRDENLLFTLLLLLFIVPLVAFISRRMATRLHSLSSEANRIREFDLAETPEISSHIKEINQLAVAVKAMKTALRSFGHYVPSSLVAKIVSGELVPELGGSRKPLTLLFTDIANFTTISENSNPEDLMQQVSVYFKELGAVILSHDGTIDKYIGDAVMAFWNAPTSDEGHVVHACAAALQAARVSNALNETWREQGKPVLYTRFGIHTGNCIVGNVGSSDRMDYTAMGDAVNMASRLEGLNKYTQTQILVSGEVRNQAGSRFAFRPVGRVVPKGKTIPTDIHELVGLVRETDMDRIASWQNAYDRYMNRDFEGAAGVFRELLVETPDDFVARKFLDNAEAFMAEPPPPDWDGVEAFSNK